MNQPDLLFWIWLSEALGTANPDFRYLIDTYGSPYDIFQADSEELERLGTLSEKDRVALSDKNLKNASAILDKCGQLGIGVMTFASELYPRLLKDIKNPPVLLYYAGTVPRMDERLCIGMVGTRNMSEYGMESAYKISYELAASQAVVVSGMAAGIDGVCAAAALKAGGTTVAVLGCGLDIVYPRHHGALMQEIARHGLILSEYPPGTKPVYFHFPVRNRIISGLSHGIVVVEAGLGSGSLITAKEAVVQGRDVFAIPANADGVGADGANGLLRDGAYFAAGTEDIISRYRYLFSTAFRADLLADAAKHSAPDRAYLRRIGVLKAVDERPDAAPRPAEAPIQERPEQKPSAQKQEKPEPSQRQTSPEKPPESAIQTARPARRKSPAGSPRPTAAPAAKESRSQEPPDAILQSLTPEQLAVLQNMPDDRPVTVDALGNLGYSLGDVIMALTMLEISGLVQKLPGALYKKA